MLSEELPEYGAFEYTYVAEGRMGLLEWTYDDSTVRVRDGVDSYLIEDGKIVAQTIHYTLEKRRSDASGCPSGGELAQVQCVGLAGQAAVPGQEPGEGKPFGVGEGGLES